MRTAAENARPGAGTFVTLAAAGLTALLGSGCGNTHYVHGTMVNYFTDSPGRLASYVVYVSALTLKRTDGAIVEPLALYEQVDLTRLSDLTELLNAPGVQIGTYQSATFTINYNYPTAAVVTVDVNGTVTPATLKNSTGSAPTSATLTITFDPNNPLVITQGHASPFVIDFDLEAGNSIDTSTSPPTVTVRPFVAMSAKPADTNRLRIRGGFVITEPSKNDYIVNARPFHDTSSAQGAAIVQVTPQTYFNVNGITYSGLSGLAALSSLITNTTVTAYGSLVSLSGISPVFSATEVYAGPASDSLVLDHVTGTVTQRTGNALTVHGANFVPRIGFSSQTLFVENNATVNLGSSTIVSEDGQAVAGLTPASVSVGQQIDASGVAAVDSSGNVTLDATIGQVRLQPTTIWGTLSAATSTTATLDLLAIGTAGFQPSVFNFAGTGSGGAVNPASYLIDTGSTNLSTAPVCTTAPCTALQARGFVTGFGSAPPDFTATAIAPVTALPQQLVIEWGSGTTTPFASSTANGWVVNLTGATLQQIRQGPLTPYATLPANLAISTAQADPSKLQLAMQTSASAISVFNTTAGLQGQIAKTVTGAQAVHKIVAIGQFDGAATFNASRLSIVLQ